jgi:hypothetical protein
VHLWVTAKDAALPAGATARWTSSRQGEIGQGPDITVSNLVVGKHELQVDVRYGDKKGKKKRKIEILNDAPVVRIVEPGQGVRVGVGQRLVLVGMAADREDGPVPAASLSWTSSLEGALGSGARLELTHLRPGAHELTLVARDRAGAEARAKVTVTITNEAPAVTISEPSSGARVRVGERLRLRGFAVDRDHRIGPERVAASSLEWVSDKDGKLGVGEDLTVDSLSGGAHTIELVAKDEFGAAGKASVRVEVRNDPATAATSRPGTRSASRSRPATPRPRSTRTTSCGGATATGRSAAATRSAPTTSRRASTGSPAPSPTATARAPATRSAC